MEDQQPNLNDTPQDPDAERVRLGLEELLLQKKVAEVAIQRKRLEQQRFWRNLILAGILLLALYGSYLVLFPAQTPSAPVEQRQTPVPAPLQTPPGPIAQNKPATNPPEPRYPSPNIRGENQANPAREALLNQIGHPDYPPAGVTLNERFNPSGDLLKARDFNNAYVQLQRLERKSPENDTLQLLKGYCLLEMGEGAEALVYFQKLGQKQVSWTPTLQWYQGLGYLLTDDRQRAIGIFRKISTTPQHPFRERSKKALQVLEGKK